MYNGEQTKRDKLIIPSIHLVIDSNIIENSINNAIRRKVVDL